MFFFPAKKAQDVRRAMVVCRSVNFSFWREKLTDLKSVDISTNQQIRFFSTDRRPGTNFLRRLSPRGSEPSLLPKVEKKHDLHLHASIMHPIILNHAFPSCSPAAIGEYWQWLFTSTP